jgi:hypothetical protein
MRSCAITRTSCRSILLGAGRELARDPMTSGPPCCSPASPCSTRSSACARRHDQRRRPLRCGRRQRRTASQAGRGRGTCLHHPSPGPLRFDARSSNGHTEVSPSRKHRLSYCGEQLVEARGKRLRLTVRSRSCLRVATTTRARPRGSTLSGPAPVRSAQQDAQEARIAAIQTANPDVTMAYDPWARAPAASSSSTSGDVD